MKCCIQLITALDILVFVGAAAPLRPSQNAIGFSINEGMSETKGVNKYLLMTSQSFNWRLASRSWQLF